MAANVSLIIPWMKERHTNVSTADSLLYVSQPDGKAASREYNTAGWLFHDTKKNPSFAFLAVLALIIFLVCVMLKVYGWYRNYIRLKARGDVEFGDESEVNYGIIREGDKEFCNVDIRSDTTSVYDTVNSFRILSNGQAGGGAYSCLDTVTSYRSLLMQRLDGSQYDSVQSYKAFLQKVTQNKDIAVEVKLLDNYPLRSKSAEHCVLLEEESISEKSEEMATRRILSVPDGRKLDKLGSGHRKHRYRQASGDIQAVMRNRSASNPICRPGAKKAGAAGSLPSILHSVSSDSSNEETRNSFKTDRRKMWAERKKMSKSASGVKTLSQSQGENSGNDLTQQRRKRHFSADNPRWQKKGVQGGVKSIDKTALSAKQLEPKRMKESVSKSDSKLSSKLKTSDKHGEESSSENPCSSHSSCSSNVVSDVVTSDSDDETKVDTLISAASDRTVDDDQVFFTLDSGPEFVSSSEILSSPTKSRRGIHAQESAETNNKRHDKPCQEAAQFSSALNQSVFDAKSEPQESDRLLEDYDVFNHSTSQAGDAQTKPEESQVTPSSTSSVVGAAEYTMSSVPSPDQSRNSRRSKSRKSSKPKAVEASREVVKSIAGDKKSEPTKPMARNTSSVPSKPKESPKKIQRFHVTFVSADVSSLNSE